MKRLQKLGIYGLLAGVVCVSLTLGEIIICRKCGHEVLEGKDACTHCGTKAPTRAREEEPEQSPHRRQDSESEYLDPKIVASEVTAGKEEMIKGNFDLARLLFKNAAALEMLTDPSDSSKRSNKILEYVKKCESGGSTRKVECSTCGGKGKRMLSTRALSGETKQQEVRGGRCSTCNGTGYERRVERASERKYALGRAMNRFMTLEQSRKHVPVGGAWVPSDIEEHLSLKQKVNLKRAMASPCDECLGVGREECDECKGIGKVKCTNRDCEDGMVTVETKNQLSRSKIHRKEKCKTCKGCEYVACEDCGGRGSIPCDECKGVGERPLCRKCSGQGITTCRRCKGSGKNKDAICAECQGAGSEQCSTCSGDGRKR